MDIDLNEAKRELMADLRKRGHTNLDIDMTMDDDTNTLHVHIHLHGPMWWRVTRWLLTYPMTLPRRALASLDDQVVWHRIRGHNVVDNYTVGETSGPLHMWDHYCHTCEMAW